MSAASDRIHWLGRRGTWLAIGRSRIVHVLHFEQMSNAITVRLPEDLAEWLETAARKTGIPKGRIVRQELEKARNAAKRPFLRWAGAIAGPSDLSMRKGFSRK